MKGETELGAWLRTVAAGMPACVFCRDTEDARAALEELATSEVESSRVVALTWNDVPPLSNELNLLVGALADAVLRCYPSVYGRELAIDDGDPQLETNAVVQDITRRLPDVHGPTCTRILTDCARHEAPTLGRLPYAEQVRQFALALAPHRLLVIIAVREAPAERLRLRSLAQGAEWLAANTKSRVVLTLPLALRAHSELDHVTYSSCVFADTPEPDRAMVTDADQSENRSHTKRKSPKPRLSLSPIVGKPHGEIERILHDRLRADPELCPLFSYNQPVATGDTKRHIVDLLWDGGRLVLEIDGDDHRGQKKFAEDRIRDYWLVMSGYRVMRFTNSRVIEQCDDVVAMIRSAVHATSTEEKV